MKSLKKTQPLVSLSSGKSGLQSLAKEAKKAADATGAQLVIEVEAEAEPESSKYPKEARIKQAENGFIVCWYENGKEYMMGGEKVYVADSLEKAMAEIKKYMG